GLLHLLAELGEAARRSAKRLLVFRRQAALGLVRLLHVVERAVDDAQAVTARAAHRDEEHLRHRHHVASAQQKALHARGLGILGDEKLDGIALVGRLLEQLARRGEALREQLLAAGGIGLQTAALALREQRLARLGVGFHRRDRLRLLLELELDLEILGVIRGRRYCGLQRRGGLHRNERCPRRGGEPLDRGARNQTQGKCAADERRRVPRAPHRRRG